MTKLPKIAIYSGRIPSTTFIERLINSVAQEDVNIYLFGARKSRVNYSKSVSVVGYKSIWFSKAWHFLKYAMLLSLFKSKQKKQLKSYLKERNQNANKFKLKYYPVLWHQPDVFHLQWAKRVEDWIWVEKFGMKLMLSLRGAHINYSPIADVKLAESYRTVFPKVDAFHAVSYAIAEEAKKYNASEDKIEVIYSGLDLEEFNLNSSFTNSILNVVSVGRSHWKKGYHYALDACKILKEKGVKFKYTIIGVSQNMELLYQINDLKLSNEVIIVGNSSFEKVKSYINSADLLLLPSVEEGIANVVLEAMAMGKLVLSTDCGGMSEVIEDGRNGFLTPIRDPEAIAEKIMEINKLSQLEREAISSYGIKTITENHNQSKMASQMVSLYNKVLVI